MYSRYIEIETMKDQERPTIKAALLQRWIYRHEKFQTALSDQARNVNGNTVWKLCEQLNIEQRNIRPLITQKEMVWLKELYKQS